MLVDHVQSGRGSVATGLLKISPYFLIKTDQETKFKSPNTSTINA